MVYNFKASYCRDINPNFNRILLFHFYENTNYLYTKRLLVTYNKYLNQVYKRISDYSLNYMKEIKININYHHYLCLLSSHYTISNSIITYKISASNIYHIHINEYYKFLNRDYLIDDCISSLYVDIDNKYNNILISKEEVDKVRNNFLTIINSFALLKKL